MGFDFEERGIHEAQSYSKALAYMDSPVIYRWKVNRGRYPQTEALGVYTQIPDQDLVSNFISLVAASARAYWLVRRGPEDSYEEAVAICLEFERLERHLQHSSCVQGQHNEAPQAREKGKRKRVSEQRERGRWKMEARPVQALPRNWALRKQGWLDKGRKGLLPQRSNTHPETEDKTALKQKGPRKNKEVEFYVVDEGGVARLRQLERLAVKPEAERESGDDTRPFTNEASRTPPPQRRSRPQLHTGRETPATDQGKQAKQRGTEDRNQNTHLYGLTRKYLLEVEQQQTAKGEALHVERSSDEVETDEAERRLRYERNVEACSGASGLTREKVDDEVEEDCEPAGERASSSGQGAIGAGATGGGGREI
ncbi:hypothetical protein Efla_001346 [Eimeria flavescens]